MSRTQTDVVTRPRGPAIPAEGDEGFSESWFAVAPSSALDSKPLGVNFLDGRIVLFRTRSGTQAVSAYCPHLGADLSVGSVVGDRIRCAFHGWEFDDAGHCRATGIGDPPQSNARIFTFPTVEQYGLIWVYNGIDPAYTLPDPPQSDAPPKIRAGHMGRLDVDPWVVGAQTLDLQHFSLPHDLDLHDNPADNFHSGDFHIGMGFTATTQGGDVLKLRATIYGTSCFYQQATLNGRPFLWVTGLSISGPGTCDAYFSISASPLPGEPEQSLNGFLDRVAYTMMGMMADDAPILQSIHFTPGRLTASDRVLSKYLHYVRKFPRSHHSQDFLN